jgi:hypothetical protein
MTGPDYLLAVAESAHSQGRPFAGEFQDMVFQAFSGDGPGVLMGEVTARRPPKDYELAPAAIVASAAAAAMEQRDLESLREIINVGSSLISKWPAWLMTRTDGHPEFAWK